MIIVANVTPVYAERPELASMTTDELLELQAEIQREIRMRTNGANREIYNGDYIVGEHIQPGRYVLRDAKLNVMYEKRALTAMIEIYSTDERVLLESYVIRSDGGGQVIELEEGMTLALSGFVSASIEPAEIYINTATSGE